MFAYMANNLAGAESAWWCPAKQASRLVRHARRDHGDVAGAAKALGGPHGSPGRHVARRAIATLIANGGDFAITSRVLDCGTQPEARKLPPNCHPTPQNGVVRAGTAPCPVR